MLGCGIVKEPEETAIRTERRDAAANRQRILDAASKLFEQHGVEQVSMNQIAIEAQIGPGTLYRRYRNKGDLCLDLIKDNLVLLFEDMEAYLKQNHAASPGQRLKGILSIFIRHREKKLQLLAGVEEVASPNPRSFRGQNSFNDQLHEIVVTLFEEMNVAGQNQPNSVFRADMLLTALKSDSYLFQREVRGYSPEMILEQLDATFIRYFEDML